MVSFQSELCHIDSSRIIVKVSAWEGNTLMGSALAEGKSVEVAEESGIQRLQQRLSKGNKGEPTISQFVEPHKNIPANTSPNEVRNKTHSPSITKENKLIEKSTSDNNSNKSTHSDDWSEELSIIDLELKRIGWNRAQENMFLENVLGYTNRNKITSYREIRLYMDYLKGIESGIEPQSQDQKAFRDFITRKCDDLITILGWDSNNARKYLYKMLNKRSRQQLNIYEFIEFTELLERESSPNKDVK